ncbi:hypothetical protein FRC20_006906 [Serendipita sp. 405]|nr:hypothetical protein FRC15_006781 [Serendipita sp. 397]KAG8836893.1 hypothetical protein FRC20_006906 [Serendipita sp. 405]
MGSTSILMVPSSISLALGIAPVPDVGHLFSLGLVSGSLPSGGAFSAIPFVLHGGWLTQHVSLDCIAIGNILSALLVIFATFCRNSGREILMAVSAMRLQEPFSSLSACSSLVPCLSLRDITSLDDSFGTRICGSVVGVIAIIAVQLLSGSINSQAGRTLVTEAQQQQQQCESASRNPLAAVIFMLALIVLYKFTNKYAVLVLVFCGAVAGQFPFM